MEKVIYIVNCILAVLVINFESNSSNDKTIIITSLLYVALILINLIVGAFLQLSKKRYFREFYYSSLLLVVGISLYGYSS